MLEKIIYKNHMNEVINFGQNGIFANSNDLRNFSWSYTSKNNRIVLSELSLQTCRAIGKLSINWTQRRR